MAKCDETRITEKRYYAISPQLFTADGLTDGTITVADTFCWKVGMCVTLVSDTVAPYKVKIKAILSETIIKVGEVNTPIYKGLDVSALIVADNAMIGLPDDHHNNKRPTIDLYEIWRQVYEEEPTVAVRSHLVDWLGRSYCAENPLPVDATIVVPPGGQDVNVRDENGDPFTTLNPLPVEVAGTLVSVPKAIRISVPLANTEYSYTFTTATRRFKFRVEAGGAKARIAWATGDTATDYWDVSAGSYYEDQDLDLTAGVTIYYRLTKSNQTVQIQYWE